MAASSRAQVLALYRALLRESRRFGAYNYRTYALRRIRDAFRENKSIQDPGEIQNLVDRARRDLGVIQRQIPFWLPAWRLPHMPQALQLFGGKAFDQGPPAAAQPLGGFLQEDTSGPWSDSLTQQLCRTASAATCWMVHHIPQS